VKLTAWTAEVIRNNLGIVSSHGALHHSISSMDRIKVTQVFDAGIIWLNVLDLDSFS
jgi:hypothetical protein